MALLIHDPRDVEKPRKRTPLTVSYWQRGCDDAKAGRPYSPPTKRGEHDRRNTGYANARCTNHPAMPRMITTLPITTARAVRKLRLDIRRLRYFDRLRSSQAWRISAAAC